MMKSLLVVVLFALAMFGCQKPNEIELTDDSLEIESITDTDPSLTRPSIDSTGVLPKDDDRFAGQISLNFVKNHSVRGIESVVMSKMVFEDRAQPVIVDGKRRGFKGLQLGIVRVNDELMVERERRIVNVSGGVEYVRQLPAFQPRRSYTWKALSVIARDSFSVSIDAPENLQVLSPLGGTRISRERELEMSWTGAGDIFIIISTANRDSLGRLIVKPVFSARVMKNTGRATLSKKFLKALPQAEAHVFTFVLANRAEKVNLGRFGGKVLVQASSIYNSYVTLN
jgi:hypothetical protein